MSYQHQEYPKHVEVNGKTVVARDAAHEAELLAPVIDVPPSVVDEPPAIKPRRGKAKEHA